MTFVTWAALVALAALGCWLGRFDVALCAAAAKTTLIGMQFMELHLAARSHRGLWLAWTLLIAGLLLLLA